MSEIGSYYAQIGVRGVESVEGAFGRVKRGLHGMASSAVAPINRLGSSLMRLVNPLTMVAGAAGTAFAAFKFAGLASDAEEVGGKFNAVFRGMRSEAEKTAADLKRYMGASTTEVKASLANLGDLFKPLGFAEKDALELSATMTKLAADLSSFSNVPMDDALRRLQGTLIGSHENALKFGVVINENTLKAKMAELGTAKLTGAAFEQAKVFARLQLLMEGTSDAQGDLSRTSDSYANTMRRMRSTLKELGETLGKFLMPIFKGLGNILSAVAEKANQLLNGEMPKFQEALDTVKAVLDGIASAIRGSDFAGWSAQLSDAFKDASDILMTTIKAVGSFLLRISIVAGQQIGEGIIAAIKLAAKTLLPGGEEAANWAGEKIDYAWTRMKAGAGTAGALIGQASSGQGLNLEQARRDGWRAARGGFDSGGGSPLGQIRSAASDSFGGNSELAQLFERLGTKYAPKPQVASFALGPRKDAAGGGSSSDWSGKLLGAFNRFSGIALNAAKTAGGVLGGVNLTPQSQAGPRGGFSFTGIAELANQMQTEAGKREEEAAKAALKTAEATGALAAAADGGALKVKVVGQPAPVWG